MKLYNILKIFFCGLLCTGLLACSTQQTVHLYQGPALGEELEATLILPVEFELLSVDGQKVSSFMQSFRNTDLSIQLPAGPHTLILIYSDIWQIDDENHDNLTTGKLVFETNMAAKEVFRLKTPPLNTYTQALSFVKTPHVYLQSKLQSVAASHIKQENPLEFKTRQKSSQTEFPRLQQLKYWWLQASEFERRQFSKWQDSASY